jgi:hypothetical protein
MSAWIGQMGIDRPVLVSGFAAGGVAHEAGSAAHIRAKARTAALEAP